MASTPVPTHNYHLNALCFPISDEEDTQLLQGVCCFVFVIYFVEYNRDNLGELLANEHSLNSPPKTH